MTATTMIRRRKTECEVVSGNLESFARGLNDGFNILADLAN
jgi:hypothetical protein